MEPFKIIDVHSSFLCHDSFPQTGARDNESNEDDFFTGYTAAEDFLSPDFNCPLNKPAVISTGVNEMLLKKQDLKEDYSNKISA